MSNFANWPALLGLIPVLGCTFVVLASIFTNSKLGSLGLAVFGGNVERTTYLTEALIEKAIHMQGYWSNVRQWWVSQWDNAVVFTQVVFWAMVYCMQAILKAALSFMVGTVVVAATLVATLVGMGILAAQKTASATADMYRKACASLKARILSWFGVTEMVNELKRENAKLNLKVRRLEILQQVADHDVEVQTEADKMAKKLNKNFRARLEALEFSDLAEVWTQLCSTKHDRMWSSQSVLVAQIMDEAPMERLKALNTMRAEKKAAQQ